MSEREQEHAHEPRGFGWLRMICVTVMLLMLYVLSVGPVLKLGPHNLAVSRLYSPLFAISDNVPAVGSVVYWYIGRVWGVHYYPTARTE